MRRRLFLGAAGLVAAGAALASPASSAGVDSTTPTVHTSVGGMGMYFREDAVGRNMRALAVTSCGTERWPVKTATDEDRNRIRLHAADVSIRYLRHRAEPSYKPQTSRASGVELRTYRVHAVLREYVEEDDGDYHLVLEDRHGRTIVAEIPDASCVGRISPVKPNILAARSHFENSYDATSSFKSTSRRVVVRGVGFFDAYHGQTGMAPNNLELHPVTGLRFP